LLRSRSVFRKVISVSSSPSPAWRFDSGSPQPLNQRRGPFAACEKQRRELSSI
jgi:hypothetical protein